MFKVIKKLGLNILKKDVMKVMTDNLGKIVEEEDKIICYVEKKKCKKGKYCYVIPCFGNAVRYNNKKLAKKLKLDKPICYIIENIDFDKRVSIFGYNDCEVIIRNCNFEQGIYGHINGKCIIENSYIKAFLDNTSISAKNLAIKNMTIKNELIYPNCQLKFSADNKLEIVDSNIGRKKEQTTIILESGNSIDLVNSKIESDIITLKAKAISANEKSNLIADKLNLNIEEFNNLNITSPLIVYNGQSIINQKSQNLSKENLLLNLKRLEFLEVLKKLKAKCERINNAKISEIKQELDNQPVIKVLKKDN